MINLYFVCCFTGFSFRTLSQENCTSDAYGPLPDWLLCVQMFQNKPIDDDMVVVLYYCLKRDAFHKNHMLTHFFFCALLTQL